MIIDRPIVNILCLFNIFFNLILQIIDRDINPYVDEWEKAKLFPAHHVMKKFGEAGLLGLTKPTGIDLVNFWICIVCVSYDGFNGFS